MKNMMLHIKKVIVIILAFIIVTLPACAKTKVNMHANITSDFSTQNIPDEIEVKTIKKVKISDDITIPQRSIITAEVFQTRKERRWHKSGFIIFKVKSYLTDTSDVPVDISDKEIYLIARKYEKVDKKEVAIISTEILLTQAASFFAPGVDILYFFTKGAIKRDRHPNWFKAGVSNAYTNSICWFWLKGKPIELTGGEEIKIKDINKEKADKIKAQCTKIEKRQELKAQKKAAKQELKAARKAEKQIAKTTPETNINFETDNADIIIATVDKNINCEYKFVTGNRTRAILTDIIDIYTGKK